MMQTGEGTGGHCCALVYSHQFSEYDFGHEHPLKPIRLELTYELIDALGLLSHPNVVVVPPRLATYEDLAYVHSQPYIARVKELSARDGLLRTFPAEFGLGTPDDPIFEGMHDASALAAGASIVAVEEVLEGRALHAFNMSGGLHHAHARYASGFCIYNDAAVAITYARRKYGARVMYIDFDAHHGDGVQDFFYDNPNVLTVSIHESGRYLFPGSGDKSEIGRGPGCGYAANVPLEPMCGDEVYLETFDAIVPELARAFKPDLLFTQMGCDPHWNDPLAHLMLTMEGFGELYRRVHALATDITEGRWVAVGGGGYSACSIVPRAWTMLFAEMCEAEIPIELPASWIQRAHSLDCEDDGPKNSRLLDERVPQIRPDAVEATRKSAQDAIDYLRAHVIPILNRSIVY